ncbi:3-deoxy-D-arabinoheptulosonate-7-phosphate synthase [Anaerosporobacter mobilis DSM 15930]|uniref:3-deoxy-D-arabinoheptulosonate-7-phosphate synthase n=1 Tax=Anaerosporobacter mobilis DSM 15930 TaxID=1120996 RepID=A0A1M7EN56_9FIRM|nr:3-deoxy-7-phosphoheptulonate synthase [Anaerosporobacter mobilis]SHL93104.1 3-deoxy-D-arabinoheptulosonate-7-phosphate synthase [Anaerosporobacter mobilis DSM 15930]
MIIVMKPNASEASIKNIVDMITAKGLEAHLSAGKEVTIIGVVGDKSKIVEQNLEIAPGVEKIVPVTETYKLANKKFHPEPSIVTVGNVEIGGKDLVIMSGPCAVESHDQVLETAIAIKKAGAKILRGGAYKPRTSPYSFQGLEEEGLRYMKEAREATGLPVICEVTSLEAIESAVKYVDMLQIGARNMQNFYLLKEVGKTGLPVLLKRGLSATIEEWLNASEYIMAEGNRNVVLCERGIRTFETATRNTLDISAVPVIKEKSHLPIIVDPSHATGVRNYVKPLAKSAVAVGADGLMIETHPNPATALSDGPQSLTFPQFEELCEELRPFAALMGKSL